MRFRLTKPEDLEIACSFIPRGYCYSPPVLRALPTIWADLLRCGQLVTAVVEDTAGETAHPVLGVGLSVFVGEGFAERVLSEPAPYLNAQLHRMILANQSPLLSEREIAAANAGDGLVLLPLHFATPSLDVSDPTVLRVLAASQELFRLVHAGYRVKRIIKEVVDIDLAHYMESSGMRVVTDFMDSNAAARLRELSPHERPYLLAINHAELPLGSAMSAMFMSAPVRFRFSQAEQRLLQCAMLYEIDEEIAADLNLSPDTLRKHWRSIYERVLLADPLFFAEEPREGLRGRGKRPQLLRYLSMHMEELRPHRLQRHVRHAVESRSANLATSALH